MLISERYSSAIRSSNMRSKEATTFSDPDVIGAFGLAAKIEPLGVALQRFFAGDGSAAAQVILALESRLTDHFGGQISAAQARVVAAKVLAWNRTNTCDACGGSGYEVIPDTPSLSNKICKVCKGTGKKLFQKQFHHDKLKFADWAQVQIEIAQSRAGQAAKKAIAPSLEL